MPPCNLSLLFLKSHMTLPQASAAYIEKTRLSGGRDLG